MKRTPLSAVTGLGMTELSREYSATSWQLAVEAIGLAIDDAGLKHSDIDGLLINKSPIEDLSAMPMDLQDYAGLKNLGLLNVVEAEGSSMIQTLQQATMAIQSGLATKVVCVFADTPIQPDSSAAESFAIAMPMMGKLGIEIANGFYSAIAAYAMAAQRYLAVYGRTTDDLALVAMANREWAKLNPLAKIKKPMTMEDHHASPWLVEPLRMLDCAYPVNGSIAVVVSDAASAADQPEPAAFIYGMGQGHKGNTNRRGFQPEIETGAKKAAETAYKMAGVSANDIDACEFYDAFSISTLINLEMCGFCEPGTAAEFIVEKGIGPGGQLPVNTGGGHLSGYYMQGATAVSEAIMQLRNKAGERQLSKLDNVLVTGYGGRMQYHAALIMGQ
ncbi:MAG: thiolase family protein [Cycloclasticus sp.]|mgnify:CR=1 FL=1|nr:thiolase [Cycloclasticus sp. 44_32_T64]